MADRDAPEEGSSKGPRSRDGQPRSSGARRGPSASGSPGARRSVPPRDGAKKPYAKRDGDKRPYTDRDGTKKPYVKRDGEKKPYAKRDGDRPYVTRDGGRPYAKRDDAARGDRGASSHRQARPTRGGANRPDRAPRAGESRPIRDRHDDPSLPDEVTARDLAAGARNELKTLSKENADVVARHLAMASDLIDDDPQRAHQHALAASRRAGRIAIVRETLAITAYATGDFALALRELRTFRRISGRDDQIALMVDSERGVGRPDRALETGRAVDRAALSTPVRVELAIAMSGARLDLGEPERALQELDIPELDPDRAFEWSPGLFAARAAVLEELGRHDEADEWQRRAVIAADALDAASGAGDLETIVIEEIDEIALEGAPDEEIDAEPATEQADESSASGAASAPDRQADPEPAPTVEDEVAEILQDAGIDDEPEGARD